MANKLMDKKRVAASAAAMPPAISPDQERKYRAQDAMRTLTRADEIRQDKSLMREVQKVAKEQMSALKKIC